MSKRKQVIFDEAILEKAQAFLERLNGIDGRRVSFSAFVSVAICERLSRRRRDEAIDNRKRGRYWYALDHKRWEREHSG